VRAVLHLAKYYPPARGGMEIHVQTLARAQARAGLSVTVVCVNHLSADGTERTHDGLGVTPDVEDRDEGVRVIRLGRWANLARLDVSPSLGKVLSREREAVELVHVHAPNPLMSLGLLPLLGDRPLVVTHHSDVVRQQVLGRLFGPLESWLYGRALLVMATSAAYAAASPLLRRFGEKVSVVPLGMELSAHLEPSEVVKAEAARWEKRLPGARWLFVGRLVSYKGADVALEALRHVEGSLLVVGTGPERKALEARADALGLSERVHFLGQVGDEALTALYRCATALWFPSVTRAEAFGQSQVEAMASGCPVLNTAVPGSGVPWVSPDGETGFTVPVGDARALAGAARRLLADPRLRARFSAEGPRRAVRLFGAEAMAEATAEAYARALGGDTLGR
jgi:rhamnosyl/mannosyltransferase